MSCFMKKAMTQYPYECNLMGKTPVFPVPNIISCHHLPYQQPNSHMNATRYLHTNFPASDISKKNIKNTICLLSNYKHQSNKMF